MRKLSLLSSFLLALALAPACGDDDDDDDDVMAPDATVSDPDAPAGDPDAAPAINAENLGTPCNTNMPCPGGETCAFLEMNATSGICTVPCTMQQMVDTCGAPNGFTGPGVGYCGLTDPATGAFSCAVGCGEQNNGDTSCPEGTTCKDLINANKVGDLCAP